MLAHESSIRLDRSQETTSPARQATRLSLGFRTEGPKVPLDRVFSHPDPHRYPTVPVSYSLRDVSPLFLAILTVPFPIKHTSQDNFPASDLPTALRAIPHRPPCLSPVSTVPFPSSDRAFSHRAPCLFPLHTRSQIFLYAVLFNFFLFFC